MMIPSGLKGMVVWTVILACLSLLYGCWSSETGYADLIVSGGRILTLGEPPTVEAVAVGDGLILAMGDRAAVERLRGPDTAVYDLGGRVLAPAFVDHHAHLLNLGFSLLYRAEPSPTFIDLAGLGSQGAIADEVRARATGLPAGTWILGQSWSQGAWGASELLSTVHEKDRMCEPGTLKPQAPADSRGGTQRASPSWRPKRSQILSQPGAERKELPIPRDLNGTERG